MNSQSIKRRSSIDGISRNAMIEARPLLKKWNSVDQFSVGKRVATGTEVVQPEDKSLSQRSWSSYVAPFVGTAAFGVAANVLKYLEIKAISPVSTVMNLPPSAFLLGLSVICFAIDANKLLGNKGIPLNIQISDAGEKVESPTSENSQRSCMPWVIGTGVCVLTSIGMALLKHFTDNCEMIEGRPLCTVMGTTPIFIPLMLALGCLAMACGKFFDDRDLTSEKEQPQAEDVKKKGFKDGAVIIGPSLGYGAWPQPKIEDKKSQASKQLQRAVQRALANLEEFKDREFTPFSDQYPEAQWLPQANNTIRRLETTLKNLKNLCEGEETKGLWGNLSKCIVVERELYRRIRNNIEQYKREILGKESVGEEEIALERKRRREEDKK